MDFDIMISEKMEEKEKKIQEMEFKKQEILLELESFISKFYDEQALKSIKEHPEKVFALGEEKARELKNKISNLKINAKEIVTKHIDLTHVWWHSQENDKLYYFRDNDIMPELVEPLKRALGELGVILSEYDLDKSPHNYVPNWTKDHNNNVKYAYGIDYSNNLCKLCQDYRLLIDSCQKINKELISVQDQKKRENIEEFWSSL